jgi:hypothetical protein
MGRLKMYKTAAEMEKAIDAYIEHCKESDERLTITGATLFLGFSQKKSLYDYKEDGEYKDAVNRLLLNVEHSYEKALHGNNVTGAIFALKNMGWKDKVETTST